jgi:hypothetical protein
MKRMIPLVTAVILTIVFINSSYLTTSTPTHEALEISEGKATEGYGKSQEGKEECSTSEQKHDANEAETTANTHGNGLNQPPEISIHTSENENTQTDTRPPDGRIYYLNSEPPYAYIPTYTPKKPSLPIMPPELEN